MINPEPKSATQQDKSWGRALAAPLTGRHLRNLARLAKGKLPRFPEPAVYAN
jgi:hypothetical protein